MSATPAWYLDAIDVRAGRAVATLREPTLLRPDEVFETGPSIFVGPPLFVPEFLRSRATGFGLARGHAQIGLFLADESEVPFPSIDAVAEFVRRIYLRGSSGDGPGESGGGPPRAPEGGTDPTDGDDGGSGGTEGAVRALLDHASSCLTYSQSCSLGEAKAPDALGTPTAVLGSDHLRNGARHVWQELLRRAGPIDAMEWTVSAQRLIAVLCRLGISAPLSRPAPKPRREVESWQPQVRHLYSILTGEYVDPVYRWGPICAGFCAAGLPASDPFEDLAFLPVPTYGVRHGPDNAQALLSAFLATPDAMLLPDDHRSIARAEVVLFAACFLTLGPDRSLGLYTDIGAAWTVMAERLVRRALGWLADNVPKLVFEPGVERLIVSAAAVPA